ncbi:hypothetical protein D3C72_647820 [compost metagenome]
MNRVAVPEGHSERLQQDRADAFTWDEPVTIAKASALLPAAQKICARQHLVFRLVQSQINPPGYRHRAALLLQTFAGQMNRRHRAGTGGAHGQAGPRKIEEVRDAIRQMPVRSVGTEHSLLQRRNAPKILIVHITDKHAYTFG